MSIDENLSNIIKDVRKQKEKDLKLNNASKYVELVQFYVSQLRSRKPKDKDIVAISPLSNGSELIVNTLRAQDPDFVVAEGLIDNNQSYIITSVYQFQIFFSLVPKSKEHKEIGFI